MPPAGDHHDTRQLSVREAARSWAPDYYIAALLAPADLRDDLITLAAFWGETGRIALTVGEDMLGEIRLQWWRDAVGLGAGPTGHPVADAVQAVIARHGLDPAALEALLDARGEELRRLPFADEAAFEVYLARADGTLLLLCAKIRGADQGDHAAALLAAAASALGRVRVAVDLPYFAAKARLPLWIDAIGEAETAGGDRGRGEAERALVALVRGARAALAEVLPLAERADRRLIDAVLPIALLEPYLRALEVSGRDPLRDVAAISPLSRVVRLIWAHVRGRI